MAPVVDKYYAKKYHRISSRDGGEAPSLHAGRERQALQWPRMVVGLAKRTWSIGSYTRTSLRFKKKAIAMPSTRQVRTSAPQVMRRWISASVLLKVEKSVP